MGEYGSAVLAGFQVVPQSDEIITVWGPTDAIRPSGSTTGELVARTPWPLAYGFLPRLTLVGTLDHSTVSRERPVDAGVGHHERMPLDG